MRLIAAMLFGIGLFAAFMFHQNYWRFRYLFDEAGRYFDAETGIVYHSQSAIGWGAIALLNLAGGVWVVIWLCRRKQETDDRTWI